MSEAARQGRRGETEVESPHRDPPSPASPSTGRRWEWAALALIVAGAGALRLIGLGKVGVDPYYDAAVRSMGRSWHNLFFGVFEPGGSVSIDKPPVDLWLQVASVKIFGFGSFSLKLPAALAGTAAVGLIHLPVRRVFGVGAGLGAALALAVMPVEVITARSDTMDAVMMLLLVVALLCLVRACEGASTAWLLAAAAALGVAFNVKLLESVVALPGLGLIALVGFRRRTGAEGETDREPPSPSRGVLRGRVVPLAVATAVFLAVSLSWLTATLVFPAHERPYAIGSTNGSAWNAAFVFNGLDRLEGKAIEGSTPPSKPGAPRATLSERERITLPGPSPTRLLTAVGPLSYERLGLEALVALLLGVPAVALGLRQGGLRRAVGLGLAVWLLTGLVLFSQMTRLHPRYVEGFTPAVAAMLGIGVAWVAGLAGGRWGIRVQAAVLTCLLAAVLAIPLRASVRAVRLDVSDANDIGAMPVEELRQLSVYLRAHQGTARYEVAADSATRVAALIVRDQLPVLVLTSYEGRTFTTVAQLQRAIARGEVRYALLTGLCGPHTPRTDAACSPPALWVRAHARDVSRQAGLTRPQALWLLPGATP